jgi:hypothetical protein
MLAPMRPLAKQQPDERELGSLLLLGGPDAFGRWRARGAVPDDFEIAEVYKEKRQQKSFLFSRVTVIPTELFGAEVNRSTSLDFRLTKNFLSGGITLSAPTKRKEQL